MATTLVYVTYVVASVVVVLFGAAACFLTFVRSVHLQADYGGVENPVHAVCTAVLGWPRLTCS